MAEELAPAAGEVEEDVGEPSTSMAVDQPRKRKGEMEQRSDNNAQ